MASIKSKLLQSLESNSNTIIGVKYISEKDIEIINQKYKSLIAAPYKIDLAHVKLDTVLNGVPKIVKPLATEYYYLKDLDITEILQEFLTKQK